MLSHVPQQKIYRSTHVRLSWCFRAFYWIRYTFVVFRPMRNDVNVSIVTTPFKEIEASLTAMRPFIPLIVFSSFKLDICSRFPLFIVIHTFRIKAFGVIFITRNSISTWKIVCFCKRFGSAFDSFKHNNVFQLPNPEISFHYSTQDRYNVIFMLIYPSQALAVN